MSAWKADALPLGDARAPAFYHRRVIARKKFEQALQLELRRDSQHFQRDLESEQ